MKKLLLSTSISCITLLAFPQGNVGIGTATPQNKLEVSGSFGLKRSETGAAIWFNSGTDVNHVLWNDYYGGPNTKGAAGSGFDGIKWNTFDGIQFRTGSAGATDRLMIMHDANHINLMNSDVGIGMSNPAYKLDVSGTGRYTGQLTIPLTPSSNAHAASKKYVDDQIGGNDDWSENGSHIYNNNSGNVGIGTSSPGAKLEVNGTARIEKSAHAPGSGNYHLELYSPDSGDPNNEVSLRFHQGSQYWAQIRYRNGGFRFTNGNNDNLVPVSAGNGYIDGTLGVGTSNPGQKLEVDNGAIMYGEGTSWGSPMYINETRTGGVNWRIDATNDAHSQGGGKYIIRQDDAGQYIFTIDGNNNNVGIGTTSPDYRLDVAAGNGGIRIGPNSSYGEDLIVGGWTTSTSKARVATSNGNLHLDSKGGSNTYLNHYHAGDVYMAAGSSQGEVGIGTTSPAYKLDVSGTGRYTGQLTIPLTPSANAHAASKKYVDDQVSGNDEWAKNGNHIYNTNSSNVGIGVNNPDEKLEVNGNIKFSGDHLFTEQIDRITPLYIRGTGLNHNGNKIFKLGSNQIYNSGGGRGLQLTVINKSDYSVALNQNYDCYGSTGDADNLATALNNITRDQVGVLTSRDAWEGAVTSNLKAAFERLGLYKALATPGGSRRPYAAIFEGGNGTASAKAVEVLHSSNSNAQYAEIRGWLINGSIVATGDVSNALSNNLGTKPVVLVNESNNVAIDGDVDNSYKLRVYGRVRSNGINETSDKRFKKDINTLESSLEKVKALRGVSYYWRQDEFPDQQFSEGRDLGLIAQEVEKILPELVDEDEKGYKSVKYSHLVPVLVEALKEQNTEMQEMQEQFLTKIYQLEGELACVNEQRKADQNLIEKNRQKVDNLEALFQEMKQNIQMMSKK